jgi:hypothetical protein
MTFTSPIDIAGVEHILLNTSTVTSRAGARCLHST